MPGGARTNRPLPLPQKGHAYATHAVHAPTTVEHPDGHATKAASQLLPAAVGRVAHATFTVPYRATVCQVIGVLSFSGFLGHILFIFLVAASLSLSRCCAASLSRHLSTPRAMACGLPGTHPQIPLSHRQIRDLITNLDADGDGKIDYKEMVAGRFFLKTF